MLEKATRQQSKDHNTSLVLRTIYEARAVSRADIARATSLARPTVSTIVGELIDNKLVSEIGLGPSAGGKPPTMLEINKNAWRLLCVDIGNQEFRGALVNLRGEIMERAEMPSNNQTGDAALQLVYSLIDTLIGSSPASVLGIAVGAPGLIDPHERVIRQSVNLNWTNVPLGQLLEKRYDKPIYLANDSQAAALAEYTFGESRESNHLLLIKMGRGIGAGIILNRELFYGDSFSAGEIGQVVVRGENPPETLESIVSTRSLLQRAQKVAGDDLTWDQFAEAVVKGDSLLRPIVEEAGYYLGVAIAHLIASLNIHNIVISGRVTQFGDVLRQKAYEAAYKHVLPMMIEDTNLTYSTLDTDNVLLGCSSLILKHELGIV